MRDRKGRANIQPIEFIDNIRRQGSRRWLIEPSLSDFDQSGEAGLYNAQRPAWYQRASMTRKRRWLLLAHSFNMDGRAASQTVTDKVDYLLDKGIELTVISAATGRRDDRFEHIQLNPWGPSGLRFDFRHRIAARYGRGAFYRVSTFLVSLLLLPFIIVERAALGLQNHSSWALPAAWHGRRRIARGDYELVFSSGGAWSAHLAAAWIKRSTGIAWIAEIHDPMVIRDDEQDDGTAPRADRNARFVQKLEGIICREADHIWWFTEPARDYALHRHPELDDKGFVVYPGCEPPVVESEYRRTDRLNLCHFGSLTDDRSLAPVISALARVIRKTPVIERDVRLHAYGGNPDGSSVAALQETGLESVFESHGRLERDPVTGLSGRDRVLKKMFEADVLLLLHGDYEWCAEYIPSKFYEYLWARRPILAVTNRSRSFDEILRQRNAYICHTHEPDSITTALEAVYRDWQSNALRVPAGEPISVASAVDRILEEVSDQAR